MPVYTKEEQKTEKRTYTKVFSCNNCGFMFEGTFTYGEVATQGKCPNCGVTPEQLRYKYKEEKE